MLKLFPHATHFLMAHLHFHISRKRWVNAKCRNAVAPYLPWLKEAGSAWSVDIIPHSTRFLTYPVSTIFSQLPSYQFAKW